MKTILISLSLIVNGWAFSQKNSFYSSDNIDSLIYVLAQSKKKDLNKAYCLDQIVRYYTNNEDYKNAGDYLLQYENLASSIKNTHALERSKYRRALWTYYASGREYLDTSAFFKAYDYFKKQNLDKYCSVISYNLYQYFHGFNGETYGWDPHFKRHVSNNVEWYNIYAKHAIDFGEYDEAAEAYYKYAIRLRNNGEFKEAKEYLMKAKDADSKSENKDWSSIIKTGFIELCFVSKDPSVIEVYENEIIQSNDEELLLQFYDELSQEEFLYNLGELGGNEMSPPEPGPWALKHDQLWAKLNPEEAKAREEAWARREIEKKERYKEQVLNGDNLLEEGKFEEAINAYCEAREITNDREQILEKLALAKAAAIKNRSEADHTNENPTIVSKRNEILDLLSVSNHIPFCNDVEQFPQVERRIDHSMFLKDIIQRTNSYEKAYENQISDETMKKVMARLDELPPIEYYNVSLIMLLEGYYGEAALIRNIGKARAQYMIKASSNENPVEGFNSTILIRGANSGFFDLYMVSTDESIKMLENVITHLESNDYYYSPKNANADVYDLIVMEHKTSLLRLKTRREQLDRTFEQKKAQVESNLKYLAMETNEITPNASIKLGLDDLEGTWYRTENIEYWLDTNITYEGEGDEEFWEGEDFDPSKNAYGLKAGDRVQLISENFNDAFSDNEHGEEYMEEEYMEEEYMEEEYMEEEYMEEEYMEEGEKNGITMEANDFENYKGQVATVIEIDDRKDEQVKILFNDASVYYVTYKALGLEKESPTEDESIENYEGEEYSENYEYEDYEDHEMLLYVDTITYIFNKDMTASLNKLPSSGEYGYDAWRSLNELIGYDAWRSLNELREAIKDARSNMNYTYSMSNDGEVNYISLHTSSDMNDEFGFNYEQDYGEGEFYDHSCVDHWMPSVGYYEKDSKYTIYLEDSNTLVMGVTYLNNPTKFIPSSIIKLRRL